MTEASAGVVSEQESVSLEAVSKQETNLVAPGDNISDVEDKELNITVTLAACTLHSPEEEQQRKESQNTELAVAGSGTDTPGECDSHQTLDFDKLAGGDESGVGSEPSQVSIVTGGGDNADSLIQSEAIKMEITDMGRDSSQKGQTGALGEVKKGAKKSKSDSVTNIARRETRASRLRAANKPQPSKSEIAQLSLDHEPPPPPSIGLKGGARDINSRKSKLKKPSIVNGGMQKNQGKPQPSKENCPPAVAMDTKKPTVPSSSRRLSRPSSAASQTSQDGSATSTPSSKIQKRKTDPSPAHVPSKKAAAASLPIRSVRRSTAIARMNLDSSMESNTHSDVTMESSFESGVSTNSRGNPSKSKGMLNGKSNLPMKTNKLRRPFSQRTESAHDMKEDKSLLLSKFGRNSGPLPHTSTPAPKTSARNAPTTLTTSSQTKGRAINKTTETLRYRARNVSPSSESQISTTSSISNSSRRSSLNAPPQKTSDGDTEGNTPKKKSTSISSLRSQKSSSQTSSGSASKTAKKGSSIPSLTVTQSSASKKSNQTRSARTTAASAGDGRRGSEQQSSAQQHESSAGGQSNGAARDWQAELAELETLCETRTKEVTRLKKQLEHNASGFQAFSVLVNYLAHRLKAFDTPALKHQLQESRKELCDAQQHLDSLTQQRDALIQEIQSLKSQHQSELEQQEQVHQSGLVALQEKLHNEHQQKLTQVKTSHEEERESLQNSHKSAITELRADHEAKLGEQEECHRTCVQQLQSDHQTYVQELQGQHQTQMDEITQRVDNIKMTLSNKVETLRQECDELRSREQRYMEQFNRDAEARVQTALASYRHLPAEIESLRAVLEMKTQEVHELRRQKLDLHRHLDELPAAREKISSLEQQIENLEAIVTIKTDYEKELSEKYANLVRRYDRESKANKRLSMDNDQLQWRLQQEDHLSSGQRSLSHSPTSSTCSTPEPLRRHPRSPLPPPQSPRGFVGPVQRSISGSGYEVDRQTLMSRRQQRMSSSMVETSLPRSPRQAAKSPRSPIYFANGDEANSFAEDSLNDNTVMNVSSMSEPTAASSPLHNNGVKRSGTYELLEEDPAKHSLNPSKHGLDPSKHGLDLKQSDV